MGLRAGCQRERQDRDPDMGSVHEETTVINRAQMLFHPDIQLSKDNSEKEHGPG